MYEHFTVTKLLLVGCCVCLETLYIVAGVTSVADISAVGWAQLTVGSSAGGLAKSSHVGPGMVVGVSQAWWGCGSAVCWGKGGGGGELQPVQHRMYHKGLLLLLFLLFAFFFLIALSRRLLFLLVLFALSFLLCISFDPLFFSPCSGFFAFILLTYSLRLRSLCTISSFIPPPELSFLFFFFASG